MISVLVSALALLVSPSPEHDCRFEGPPRVAVGQALVAWDRLDRARIRSRQPVQPTVQVFDLRCQYTLSPTQKGVFRAGGRSFRPRAFPHGGMIDVGDGNPFPVGERAFATTGDTGEDTVFVIALPEVWAADVDDPRDPNLLFMAVFMHEFAHVQHMAGLSAGFEALEAAGYSAFALGDDVMQRTFEQNPEYTAAWQQEMDVLLAAATSPDQDAVAVNLSEARNLMSTRRARWLSGPDHTGWADADNLFLTMEGSGQWAAYSWLVDPQGGDLSAEAALAFMRTRWWSQEAGMMLMLALDRLTPEWPSLTFGSEAATLDHLLARALDGIPADP